MEMGARYDKPVNSSGPGSLVGTVRGAVRRPRFPGFGGRVLGKWTAKARLAMGGEAPAGTAQRTVPTDGDAPAGRTGGPSLPIKLWTLAVGEIDEWPSFLRRD